MERRILIPDGSGTSELWEVQQGWVKLVSALLQYMESHGEIPLPEAATDMARYVIFDEEAPSTNCSASVAVKIGQMLAAFGSDCEVHAIGFDPGTGGRFGAVQMHSRRNGATYGFWFSDYSPYMGTMEADAAPAKRQKSAQFDDANAEEDWEEEEAMPRMPPKRVAAPVTLPARLFGKKATPTITRTVSKRPPPASQLNDRDLGIVPRGVSTHAPPMRTPVAPTSTSTSASTYQHNPITIGAPPRGRAGVQMRNSLAQTDQFFLGRGGRGGNRF